MWKMRRGQVRTALEGLIVMLEAEAREHDPDHGNGDPDRDDGGPGMFDAADPKWNAGYAAGLMSAVNDLREVMGDVAA